MPASQSEIAAVHASDALLSARNNENKQMRLEKRVQELEHNVNEILLLLLQAGIATKMEEIEDE